MPAKVFVTDGEQRPALAIVRSLARQGMTVVVGSDRTVSLASCSRACSQRVTYPSPLTTPEAFTRWLREFVARERIEVVLPVTDVTTYLVSSNAVALSSVTALSVPRFEAFDFLSDKGRLAGWATQCGVRVPRTECLERADELHAVIDRVTYPAVVKPVRSRWLTPHGWRSGGVHYACSRNQLLKLYRQCTDLSAQPSLIQERICGPGVGLFVLFDRGRRIAEFAHRRLREHPPSGGVSVLRESVAVDAALREYADRLLGPLGWHGVAMLEFKRDAASGDPYLIEVNGRFWGSLQLAVDAGVDFPTLSVQLALGQAPAVAPSYREGVRSRWLLGDVDQLLLRLRRSPGELQLPETAPGRARAVWQFLQFCGRNLHYEIESMNDPGPGLYELREYVRALVVSAFARARQVTVSTPTSTHV